MSAHPKCPSCGVELESYVDPVEGEAQAVFYLGEIRRACEMADLLGAERERRLNLAIDYYLATMRDLDAADLSAFRDRWRTLNPEPEVLREWRLRHPKRNPQPGENPGEKSPEPEEIHS